MSATTVQYDVRNRITVTVGEQNFRHCGGITVYSELGVFGSGQEVKDQQGSRGELVLGYSSTVSPLPAWDMGQTISCSACTIYCIICIIEVSVASQISGTSTCTVYEHSTMYNCAPTIRAQRGDSYLQIAPEYEESLMSLLHTIPQTRSNQRDNKTNH